MKAHETKLFLANMDYVDDPVSFGNELQRMLDHSYENDNDLSFVDNPNILEAFSWGETPQGYRYWTEIYRQIDIARRDGNERQE